MIKCNGPLLSILIATVVGCASEPVRVASNDRPKVKELQPHMLPDAVYHQVSLAIESGAKKAGQIQQIEAALCNGSDPRVSIKRTFTYRPPSTNGLPLDEANAWKISHLEGAQKFLKKEFFYYAGQSFSGVSQPENMDQPLDEDQLDVVDREAYDRRNFVSSEQLLLKTYAARFLKPLFFREGGYVDMQFLFQQYTFRIPYDVVTKFEKIGPTPRIKLPADNHYFGYDRDIFSPKMALDHKDFLWRWIARNSTSISQAAIENGEVRFLVEMKLDLFCKYAVPISDLRSH